MTLSELQQLLDSDQFDHATVRNPGGLCEALHIYVRADNPFGFDHAGSIFSYEPHAEAAYGLVRSTGVSVGARGQG